MDSKTRISEDKFLYVYFDCEAFRDETTGEIHAFVGILVNGVYSKYPLNKFVEVICFIRRRLDVFHKTPHIKIILLVYNYQYDGKLLEECHKIGDYYNASFALAQSNRIITTSQKDKLKFEYPRLEKLLKGAGLRNIHIYDVCSELKGGESQYQSKGSLEYHASRLGFKWQASIKSDIYLYNECDLLALEQIFLKQDGEQNLLIALNIQTQVLRQPYTILLCKMVQTYLFMELKKLNPPVEISTDKVRLTRFKEQFELPFPGKLVNGVLHFQRLQDDGTLVYRSSLHGVKFKLNSGGLHAGILNTTWKSDSEGGLYFLDFSSLYPQIIASKKCPLLPPGARIEFERLIEKRLEAKRARDNVTSASLKLMLVSVYGRMRKSGEEATKYVTFIAQVSLAWLCYIFSDDEITLIDLNTDGIVIKTKMPFIDLENKIRAFNRLVSEKLHNSQVEILKLKALYYKHYNSNIQVYESGEFRIKGEAFCNKKLLKDNNPEDETELKYYYNIVNYDRIITNHLKNEPLEDAIALGNVGGKKVQFFDGIPLKVSSIESPTFSKKTGFEAGYTSKEDLSKACVTGFLLNFKLSDDIKSFLKKQPLVNLEVKDLLIQQLKKAERVEGRVFVKYNHVRELTKEYLNNSLSTFDECCQSEEEVEGSLVSFACSTVLFPYEINPVTILDYDFKTLEDWEVADIKSAIWTELQGMSEHILYAETNFHDCRDIKGVIRKGIHVFVRREHKKVFSELYSNFLDKAYLRVTSSKSINLYISTSPEYNLKLSMLGDVRNLERAFVDVQLRKKPVKAIQDVVPDADKRVEVIYQLGDSLLTLPEEYTRWLSYMTSFVDSLKSSNVDNATIEEYLCNMCIRTYHTEMPMKMRYNNLSIIQDLIDKYPERLRIGGLYSLTHIAKASGSSLFTDMCEEKELETKVQKKTLQDTYFSQKTESIDIESFYKLESQFNFLNAPTGSGKTHHCILKLAENIYNGKPFVFLSNSKDNAAYVSQEVLFVLQDWYLQNPELRYLEDEFIRSSFLLNNNTSSVFRGAKWIFTTYHYFSPKFGSFKYYKQVLEIYNSSNDYIFYVDELDEFLTSLEFVYQNGGRYNKSVYTPDGAQAYKLSTYCPAYDNYLSAPSLIDKTQLCESCAFYSTSRVIYSDVIKYKPTPKGYEPIEHLHYNDTGQVQHRFDFMQMFELKDTPVFDPEHCHYTYSIKSIIPLEDYESKIVEEDTPKDQLEDRYMYQYFKQLVKKSLFCNISVYYPTIDNKYVLNPSRTVCHKYPHYSCGVYYLTGVMLDPLSKLFRYIVDRGTQLFGFTATLNNNHDSVLRGALKKAKKTEPKYYSIEKSNSILESIDIFVLSDKFHFTSGFFDMDYKSKVICFFPRKKDAEKAYTNASTLSNKVCLFDGKNYTLRCKQLDFKQAKVLFTYSRSVIGRGVNLTMDLCILDANIYKPYYSYINYSQSTTGGKKSEKQIHSLDYVIQNIGRVLRSSRKKVIILTNSTPSTAIFVKNKLTHLIPEDKINIHTNFKDSSNKTIQEAIKILWR